MTVKLLIVPDAEGYQSTDGESSIHVALAGGAGRSRLDKVGTAKTVNATWTMNPNQYQYWRAFYRTGTKEGSLPFLCDLLSEDGTGPVEHTCRFIPGSVTMPSQRGLTYVQQARLEVEPVQANEEVDNAIMMLFSMTDGELTGWYNALEHLCNVTIPNSDAFDAV